MTCTGLKVNIKGDVPQQKQLQGRSEACYVSGTTEGPSLGAKRHGLSTVDRDLKWDEHVRIYVGVEKMCLAQFRSILPNLSIQLKHL